MARNGTVICGICRCSFGDGTCVHFDGEGTTDDPLVPVPVIDDDDQNMVECGPGGLAAFPEPGLLSPPAVRFYGPIDETVAWEAAQILYAEAATDESYDTDSMHDEENDKSRITFKTAGLYLVTLNVRWSKTNDDTATGDLAAFIRRNGAQFLALDSFPIPLGATFAKHSICAQYPFEAGDYVEGMVKQDVKIGTDKQAMRITADVINPTLSAVFVRRLKNMHVLGIPDSA